MEDLARCEAVDLVGLLHFDLVNARDELLPRVVQTYKTMMSDITALTAALQKELLGRLARYTDRYNNH